MVVKESRPAESGKSSVGPREAAASSAIEDSGWTFTPPPGFAPWKNAASFGTAAGGHGNLVWGDGIFTVRVTYFSPGQHWAARYCQEDGKSASQTTHHGFPVEICADIPLRGEAPWRAGPSHCDLFVIQGDRYAIEALYQYPIGRREEKLALFMRAIEALRPAGK
jgi:hypothetical protein